MHILITGACGFVGSTLAKGLVEAGHEVTGIDNLIRSGSHLNLAPLKALGCQIIHGDIRNPADLETLPKVDWVLDCAANASVLAGVDGKTSSRQLIEHNLGGTINLLEYCRQHGAGFILLSTSRVYSIVPLTQLKLKVETEGGNNRYSPDLSRDEGPELRVESRGARVESRVQPSTPLDLSTLDPSRPLDPRPQSTLDPSQPPISPNGLTESFPTTAPVSLYGATKLASEQLALEYGFTYDFPVWINRCGVMAGAGQFGQPAQGIFAFWIHSFREGSPLKYIGFDGLGRQVRDCLHPRDLLPLLEKQFQAPNQPPTTHNQQPKIINCSGGVANSMSLAELTAWCKNRFPESETANSLPRSTRPSALDPRPTESRPFDIAWMVLDPSLAATTWNWEASNGIEAICEEIATFAEANPYWLAISRS